MSNIYLNKNFRLPDWAQTALKNDLLVKISKKMFHLFAYTPLMARIRSGFLLKKWLDTARSKSDTMSTTPNVYVFSAHDATVANMLYSLDVFTEKVKYFI